MQRCSSSERRTAFAIHTLVAVLLVLVPARLHGQYLSLGGGPQIPFTGLGDDRPTGVTLVLSLEQERFVRGLAWRGEISTSGFKAPPAIEDVTGTTSHVAVTGHAVYVIPHPVVEAYASAGAGPAWRRVGRPSVETSWGVLGALGAGFRVGDRVKRVFLEARVAGSAAGAGGGGRSVQTWGSLLIGVSLGRDVGGRVELSR